MLLGRLLDEAALRSPQSDALWFKERHWTFGELKASVDRKQLHRGVESSS